MKRSLSRKTFWVTVNNSRCENKGKCLDVCPNNVFDRFWLGDKARAKQGAGLGLATARQLVQTHGGTISVTTRLDSGTSFTIDPPT